MHAESTNQHRDKLLAAAGEAHLYAILDGASVPNLLSTLNEHALTSVCLLPGEMDAELAQVAPYLVDLDDELTAVDWLLSEGWGQHWGIFLITQASFRAVRQHARAQLRVYGPDGEPLFFRYYDPRVLRVFLPTCQAHELVDFFGPVDQYLLEAENADLLLSYAISDGVLQSR